MPADPGNDSDHKGLIRESYRIEGIHPSECRSVFVDWALSLKVGEPREHIEKLLAKYGPDNPDHPMTKVLREGLETPPTQKRRGGRAGRFASGD